MILFSLTSLVFSLNVVVSIEPYALIVKNITNGKAEVRTLIDPGVNPHTFSPRMSDIKTLSAADIVIMNGLGLEAFLIEKLGSVKTNGDIILIEDLIPKNILKNLNDDSEHFNPHVWLSIDLLTRYIIPGITEKLAKLDEENAEYFEKNSQDLIDELEKLRNRYSEILSKYTSGTVLVYHPSFYYFFKEYGINTLSISKGHGDEPTMKKLMEVINSIKSGKIIGMFAEKQQNIEPIELISRQTGMPFSILDPLGYNEGSIVDLFERNFESISKVLRR